MQDHSEARNSKLRREDAAEFEISEVRDGGAVGRRHECEWHPYIAAQATRRIDVARMRRDPEGDRPVGEYIVVGSEIHDVEPYPRGRIEPIDRHEAGTLGRVRADRSIPVLLRRTGRWLCRRSPGTGDHRQRHHHNPPYCLHMIHAWSPGGVYKSTCRPRASLSLDLQQLPFEVRGAP